LVAISGIEKEVLKFIVKFLTREGGYEERKLLEEKMSSENLERFFLMQEQFFLMQEQLTKLKNAGKLKTLDSKVDFTE
jgi:hypothetical protein